MLNRLLTLTKNLRVHLMVAAVALAALAVAFGTVPVAYAEEGNEEATTTETTTTDAAATEEKDAAIEAAANADAAEAEVTTTGEASAAAEAAEATAAPAEGPEGTTLMGNDLLWFGKDETLSGYQASNDILGAGETITVSNSGAAGSIRLAGRVITLDNATVGESVTLSGQKLAMNGGSANAVALVGQSVTFSGTANELWIFADSIVIDGVVTGDVHVGCNKIEIGPNAQIGGVLEGEVSSEPNIDAAATIADNQLEVKKAPSDPSDFKSMLDYRYLLFSVANCVLIAVLAEWVASGHTAGAGKLLKSSVGGYLGATIIGAIVIPIAIVLVCVPIVTIPAAIAAFLAVIAIALVSNGFTAAALGRMIFPNMGRFKSVILMGILVGLLCGLPYVGAPVRGLCFLFMLGYAVRSLRVAMLERREERDRKAVQF